MKEMNIKKEFNKITANSTLREIQEYAKKMIKARGFDDETPQDIMLLLTEELGEVAKEVRKSTNIKMDVNSSRKQNLGNEIADVFNYILALCIATNIDLFKAYKEKEEINCERIWK